MTLAHSRSYTSTSVSDLLAILVPIRTGNPVRSLVSVDLWRLQNLVKCPLTLLLSDSLYMQFLNRN